MRKNVRVVSRKTLFDGEFLKFFEVKLGLPSGGEKTHYNVERVPVVSVFPITDTYEIYLIYQYRYLLNKNILEAVAGRLNRGEDPLSCAKRELLEEAGIRAGKWRRLTILDLAASFIKAKQYIFLAKDLKFEKQDLEEHEDIKVARFSLDEAVQKVLEGEIATTSSVIGILLLDRLRMQRKL